MQCTSEYEDCLLADGVVSWKGEDLMVIGGQTPGYITNQGGPSTSAFLFNLVLGREPVFSSLPIDISTSEELIQTWKIFPMNGDSGAPDFGRTPTVH